MPSRSALLCQNRMEAKSEQFGRRLMDARFYENGSVKAWLADTIFLLKIKNVLILIMEALRLVNYVQLPTYLPALLFILLVQRSATYP